MEKILDIVDAIAHEKGLQREKVKEALKTAFIQTAKRLTNSDFDFIAEIEEDKSMHVYQIITVVANDDEKLQGEESALYISLDEALELDDDVELGDQLQIPFDVEAHGRTAAATLHREVEYHVQRLVEDDVYSKYQNKIGTIVNGRVIRVDNEQNTYIEIDEVRAKLPMKSRIKGEKFAIGDHLSAVVRRVHVDKTQGILIELSRTSPKFLEELLKLEVPEIADGAVTVEKCARIPGERAKIALLSNHPQIDAVGATVGVKGVRINAVSQELKGENIDCIEYTPIKELFIARIMSPAIISSVSIEDSKAIVVLPSDQKSKAIGKNGINIRLASMLSGLEIELVEQDSKESAMISKEEEKEDISSLAALFN